MNKEELKQIYYLNKEVEMWQKELNGLQCKSLIKGQEITGMPFAGGTSDKTGEMAVAMSDIDYIIRGKLAEIQLKRKDIIEYINDVEDSYMRQIIFLRNVSCMKWEEIADELGGTSESIKKAYYRYLKKQCCPTCPDGK